MLIINASDDVEDCFFVAASEAGCLLVVIRIAAYINRFSKWFYARFGGITISPTEYDNGSVALP